MDNDDSMIDGLVAELMADHVIRVIKRTPVEDRVERAQLVIDKLTTLMERARK